MFILVHALIKIFHFTFTGQRSRRNRRRFNSDFSYVSGWVKYSMFFFNFLFWIMGGKFPRLLDTWQMDILWRNKICLISILVEIEITNFKCFKHWNYSNISRALIEDLVILKPLAYLIQLFWADFVLFRSFLNVFNDVPTHIGFDWVDNFYQFCFIF